MRPIDDPRLHEAWHRASDGCPLHGGPYGVLEGTSTPKCLRCVEAAIFADGYRQGVRLALLEGESRGYASLS